MNLSVRKALKINVAISDFFNLRGVLQKALITVSFFCYSIFVFSTALYAIPTHGNGRKSLQFSFASKLLHMVSPSLPIYDSLVAAFYFYEEPNRKLTPAHRVASLVGFHNFLFSEYQRILTNNLLDPSIAAFRKHFNPQHFTDEKIIDSLIWGYVSMSKDGQYFEKIYRDENLSDDVHDAAVKAIETISA